MIIPMPLVVSLLLAISYATEFKYEIELARCSQDTACYTRKSCQKGFDTDPNNKKVLADFALADVDTNIIGGNCDLVIQIKELSDLKFLVMMQVEGTGLKVSEGLNVKQGDIPVMHCKDATTATPNDQFTMAYRGLTSTIFEDNKIFCSFELEVKNKELETVASVFRKPTEFGDKYPTVIYSVNDEVQEVKYESPLNIFWKKPHDHGTKCSAGEIVLGDSSIYQLTEADLSRAPVKCGADKIFVSYEGKEQVVEEISCNGNSKWSWGGATPGEAKTGTKVQAGCIVKKYCTMCTELTKPECPTPSECSELITATDDDCQVHTCPKDSFTEDGKMNVVPDVSKKVECKKKGDGAAWFIHDTEAREVTALVCRSVKDCKGSDITKACPTDVECLGKPTVNMQIFNISCSDGTLHHGGVPVASPITCDRETGEWSQKGDFYCANVAEAKSDEKVSTGGGGSGAIAAAVVGVLLVLCAVGGLGYYFLVYKKKQAMSKAKPASSSKATSKKGGVASDGKSKESNSKAGDKKESASDQPGKDEKKDEKPKDAAATPADPTKPAESAPATPGAAPTPAAGAAAPAAAAAPPKSDPPETGPMPV